VLRRGLEEFLKNWRSTGRCPEGVPEDVRKGVPEDVRKKYRKMSGRSTGRCPEGVPEDVRKEYRKMSGGCEDCDRRSM
jgi:hypothetical protein